MACGVPTIVADFGGSTEYATDAILVRVPELIKPFGIYGDWDVPGKWGEPDYDHLVEQMRNVYENYVEYKERALDSSERIRTKFSWDAAAEKAMVVLDELSKKYEPVPVTTNQLVVESDIEKMVNDFIKEKGFLNYEVKLQKKRNAIFAVDCWPNTEEKMKTLEETIYQIHKLGYPVLVSSHYPLPEIVIKQADYYIYEQRDIMSGDDKPIYWRIRPDGTRETKQANVEYQGVAALNCFRNSIDFCRGRFDWIYQMGADMEVDLEAWLSLVLSSEKPMVCIPYEGIKNGIGGGLWAGKTEVLDKVIPRLNSWKEYADAYPDVRFVAERWIFNHIKDHHGLDDIDWINIDTANRYDNVDRTVWAEDDFQCHFVEGPFLNIVGISNKEYDVEWSLPNHPMVYTLKQKAGMWSRPNKKYYQDWSVKVKLDGEVKFEHKLDLKGKRVLISMGSRALGDTLAWMPYVDEFRKKHQCHVICSGWWADIFDYPEIEFVKPGAVIENIHASYAVGCFDDQLDMNVENWRLTTLQKVAADILGLEYVPVKAKLKVEHRKDGNGKPKKPYICFSEFSTMQNKFWNREGAWQKVIDYLVEIGYDCVSVSAEMTQLNNVIRHNGQAIEKTITDIAGAEFYVGLNHGPAWVAYSLGVPCVMITGVSEPWNDFPNPYRIDSDVCRPGCFNDPSVPINRGWDWCPREKSYACTNVITEEAVMKMIDKVVEDFNYASKIESTEKIDGDGGTPSGDGAGQERVVNVEGTVA